MAGDKSPDRLDAYVWAGTELMLSSSYGEIPMGTAGSLVGSGFDNTDVVVEGILRQIARLRDEQQRQGEAAPAPEFTEDQLRHQAALARLLGNLNQWGGPRWG